MHADRTNRILLALVGLLAVAIGTGGLLTAGGVFGNQFSHQRVIDNQFVRYFAREGDWLWPAIAGVAFVIVLLALFWLLRLLFSSDRAGDLAVPNTQPREGDHATGRTNISASALASAVAQEIETYHGVLAARARVLGERADPSLAIEVKASRYADLSGLVQRIEHEAIVHARGSLESTRLPVKLDITVSDKVSDRGAARAV